ncbi:hypothetical protein BDV32DRAFT_153556 [Aspergillus pseudonomiae]|nr:hypothetical protein BDV32DRAFT_153556 [Aspergillus pseudonomiae]
MRDCVADIKRITQLRWSQKQVPGNPTCLAHPAYSREEIAKWKEEFQKLNKDYDGYFDPYELIGIANEKGLGMTDEEAVAWVKKLDFNGDGRVSFGEFLAEFGKRNESSS